MEENSNNNSLHEPTAEYGVARKAKVSKWEHVRELAETDGTCLYTPEELRIRILLEQEKDWLPDFLARQPEVMEELDNPKPCTKEELIARVEQSAADPDEGISPEELFRQMDVISELWRLS